MILFAKAGTHTIYATQLTQLPDTANKKKLEWLFNGSILEEKELAGWFIGPRKEMISPWSTNAVEITQNMGIEGVVRIEEFREVENADAPHDNMLEVVYEKLGQSLFDIDIAPASIQYVEDIASYNQQEGLALSPDEISYLNEMSDRIGRNLTDSEVFGFSQVNSEHCRHKIFNGTFVIDGEEQPSTLFKLIRKTSEEHPNHIVSAYKDNVAFINGPEIEQFAPESQDKSDFFSTKAIKSVLSLKAETHNFPTTVEPFNGAATGSGGEIRDRLAGGKASLPLAGTAVYMTPYSRLEEGRMWEQATSERPWLYQSPIDILIKASNGASDFGNKFGQPLINGSVLTFEHEEDHKHYGFDKVIMLAGGIGFGKAEDSLKATPEHGDKVVILGGDNYRIGMGGGAVSSVATGEFSNSIELNAIQRSNPEMQKRVANAIRAMAESGQNPIVSIHDHGAGGHLNCLSELVEETGGKIDVRKLPIGDPTLSAKEIVGNESQERMGLVMPEKDLETLQKVAERERAPMYVVGETTGDMRFTFEDTKDGEAPIDLTLADFFGSTPKTLLEDEAQDAMFSPPALLEQPLEKLAKQVLQLEAVACKDWLTNKVDRSVTGKVATQQTCGVLQLPLNNLGVTALDYTGTVGLGTAIGHAPVAALGDEVAGSRLAIAESLTNLIWAPLTHGLQGVSLSANWMWPAKNEGENARLYSAVESVSNFACALGINIPTGKDSLSMVQKYPDGKKVYAPGTVIISAVAEVSDIRKTVTPDLKDVSGSQLLYVDFSKDVLKLGGSSIAQVLNKVGTNIPTVVDSQYFVKVFGAIQELISEGKVLAGHDISSGGLFTALAEMCFPVLGKGMDIDLRQLNAQSLGTALFAENPGIILQVEHAGAIQNALLKNGVHAVHIGSVTAGSELNISFKEENISFSVDDLRSTWFRTSQLLDRVQSTEKLADERAEHLTKHALNYALPSSFTGSFGAYGIDPKRKVKSGIKAAIIREKGVNGDREMAYIMHLAGFDVKDVHMTDLISGREDLSDVNFIVFVGGFSNSDVLGSAKGWAGAFMFNEKAKAALDAFFAREDTLSLGVCNGCQLMIELGLVYPEHEEKPKMLHNDSGKFESSFLSVQVPENDSVMLSTLGGSELGIWVAHGEGKFHLPYAEDAYKVTIKYSHSTYPANPNGSAFDVAGLVSSNGRHLAMMPHLERAFFPWQCGYYPAERNGDDCTPWLEAFVNAKKWVEAKINE